MTRRSLTVELDDDVVRRARVLAAHRGTSVSQLVSHQLEKLVDQAERHDASWERARRAMAEATPCGGRNWTRDELYDR
ncbi:DUF6364 family protein [Nocardioides speluncae]|uniref:DUF6364 family protein n=1 Tax=Nocardioides speluncae TaxID=2670337 RepID=UPI0012B163A8|nr:DUF6364 family protein [Nocardioides speluncae]